MRELKTRLGKTNAVLLLASASVGLVTLLSSARALAEDPKARAAVLAREAEDLLAAGKTVEACDKLEESQSLDPRGGTVLDLALCREKEGRIGTAYLLFDEAERIATEEKRSERVTTAKNHKKELFLRVPRVTVTVPKEVLVEGLEVRVGLAANARALNLIPPSEWGKSFPTDPGEVKVMVTAPKKATWEQAFKLAKSERKNVTVPAMKDGDGPPPLPPPITSNPTDGGGGGTPPPTDSGNGGGTGKPSGPPKPTTPAKHEASRVVVDAGILAGGHLSLISQSPLSDINGTQYIYKGPDSSEFLASCGNTTAVPGAGDCDATYNPQLAVLGGAQLFLGYAITDTVQFGGRFFGGVHYPFGFMVLGGPSVSFEAAGPLWLGVSALVGTSQVEQTITGARGSIPEAYVGDNKGEDQVKIKQADLAGRKGDTPFICDKEITTPLVAGGPPRCPKVATADAFAGFEIGGSFEISIVLVDNPQHDGTSGSFMFSAWPAALWAPGHGAALWLPVGIGYRFY